MGLGDFSRCELEGSLPLPPLVSSSPSLQWSSFITAGPFFPRGVSGASHLGKGLSRDLCLCSHGWGQVLFPHSSASVPALWCLRAQPCSALAGGLLWTWFSFLGGSWSRALPSLENLWQSVMAKGPKQPQETTAHGKAGLTLP